MVNICAPGIGIPQNQKEWMQYMNCLQDLGIESLSMFVGMHNSLMRVMNPFGGTEEIDMGTKIPKMLMLEGTAGVIGHTLAEMRKFLP